MKRFLTLLTIALSLVFINHSCKPDNGEDEFIQGSESGSGSIYGIVTDKVTGEPVKNANVQLRPTGETSLTGTDGRYEFLNIEDGNYSIKVSKNGYTNLIDDYVITVDGTKAMRRDVQIEKFGNIKGTVRSAKTNEGLKNVYITLRRMYSYGGELIETIQSSSYGSYEFKDLEPGKYRLAFERNNYGSTYENITVQSDHTHTLDVYMYYNGE